MGVSPLSTPSATLAALERHGLHTKKSLGQHFLVDDNVLSRMLELAALAGDETVIEVGPGIGTLTVPLLERARAVIAVERDRDLVEVLLESTREFERFTLISADAVEVSPDEISASYGPPTALVANLPYGVAATVVLRFFRMLPSIRQSTVMVQAEVADRMAAEPGTKAYGAYSVKLQLIARPVGRFNVPPGCFLPPPRVDSAVIRLERHAVAQDPDLLRAAAAVADAAFAQRRKTLRNSLRATSGLSASVIDDALSAAGIDGGLRAEALPPQAFVEIARNLSGAGIRAAHRL